MRKKSAAMASPETPINPLAEDVNPKIQDANGFYACYLLTSLCPRFKGHTYIGFTVNPRRRIRQHNGEIRSGAFRTKRRRPWEMVFCIYGFPTNVSALQFEWAWQHPTESLQVRQAAATFKSFSGVANKIKLAYTMLNLPAWKSLNITLNYFSTRYSNHSAACPSLPDHMEVQVLPMDELPCYTKTEEISYEDDDEFECDIIGAVKESSIDEFESSSSREKDSDGSRTLNTGKIEQNHSPVSKVDYNSTVRIESPVFNAFFLDDREDLSKLSAENDEGEASLKRWNIPHEIDEGEASQKRWNIPYEIDEGEASIKRCNIPYEMEVIDLLSPSPDCRIVSERKKRRVSASFPVIIDLT